MRLREVYETYHSFRRVLAGDGTPHVEGMSSGEPLELLASMQGKVDLERLYCTGHSFGGATVVRVPFNI
jgi:platelet-activating factor acetylhydrolase